MLNKMLPTFCFFFFTICIIATKRIFLCRHKCATFSDIFCQVAAPTGHNNFNFSKHFQINVDENVIIIKKSFLLHNISYDTAQTAEMDHIRLATTSRRFFFLWQLPPAKFFGLETTSDQRILKWSGNYLSLWQLLLNSGNYRYGNYLPLWQLPLMVILLKGQL